MGSIQKSLLNPIIRLIAVIALVLLLIYIVFLRAPYTIDQRLTTEGYLSSVTEVGNFSTTENTESIATDNGVGLKEFVNQNNDNYLYIDASSEGSLDNNILTYYRHDIGCDTIKHFGFIQVAWELGNCGEYYHYYYSEGGAGIMFITNGTREDLDEAIKDYINQGKSYEN